MPKVAALIVGIGGWDTYTKPLIDSIRFHEPDCEIVAIDNASTERYPHLPGIVRTTRISYAAAINCAHDAVPYADWFIVLSNDVFCTGPFIESLDDLGDVVAGPQLWTEHGYAWIVGWCVVANRHVWDTVGGWDEAFRVSSWEDVDFSVSAQERGFALRHLPQFPFVHRDQRQRFGLPDYAGSEAHNMRYFVRKRQENALGITAAQAMSL